jgi:hypothetical protein
MTRNPILTSGPVFGVHLSFRESLILVDGELAQQRPTQSFLRKLLMNAPRHTGWTPWADLYGAQEQDFQPYVLDGGWEALLDLLDPARAIICPSLDFWRIETRGVFYHIRGLEDDFMAHRGLQPRTELDFCAQIGRVAEVMSMGLSLGRSLGCDEAKTSLVFGFRWTGLAGRSLTSWASPERRLRRIVAASQDEITTQATVPLETPQAGIAPHVENVIRDLFALFNGLELASAVIEDIVKKALGHRY